jgi:hypothetical protein
MKKPKRVVSLRAYRRRREEDAFLVEALRFMRAGDRVAASIPSLCPRCGNPLTVAIDFHVLEVEHAPQRIGLALVLQNAAHSGSLFGALKVRHTERRTQCRWGGSMGVVGLKPSAWPES